MEDGRDSGMDGWGSGREGRTTTEGVVSAKGEGDSGFELVEERI